MTTFLIWVTRLGVYAVFFSLFGLTTMIADRFGPVLRVPALLVSIGVVSCVGGAFYSWGRKNSVAVWRCLYLAATVILGFIAYVNTGFVWVEDRAMILAQAEDRLEALPEHPPPGPRPEWIARVKRDLAIAQAQETYEVTIARLAGGRSTPLPRALTPCLYVASLGLFLVALLPSQRIVKVVNAL